MAKKTGNRITYKEVGNQNRNYETLPDEIALRDEILQLKRQMMVLRRTNEQYLVKLRKYEDEAKRKDKQVEQLMDPRKNADVTKVLSTKGAAILMNLKDQNNALIQMLLNKDLHIRRLVAEIKMSKLYATTRKNECYRAEINRLRNLLIKSQEALKENIDVQQQQQQERSICAGGNSVLEFSSSSDQSSPRDLDELRVTILSLESHIQHSNDLLAKKNQEISSLTNEVNFLKKCFRYKTYKNKAFDYDAAEYKNKKFSTTDFTYKWSKPSTKISTQNVFDLLEKNEEDEENLPHSAPAASSKWFSSVDSTPKCNFRSPGIERRSQNPTGEKTESAVIVKTNREIFEKVSILGNSLSHNLTPNELLKEKNPSNHRTICTKVKWMKALSKYRELKKLKGQIFTVDGQTESDCEKVESFNATEFSKSEVNELEMEKNVIQTKPQDLYEELKTPESLNIELNENITSLTPNAMNSSAFSNDEMPKICYNSETSSVLNKNEEYLDTESIWNDETQQIEREVENEESKHSVKSVQKNVYNLTHIEDTERKKIRSLREIYRQSLDSSFDSECSYSMRAEVRQVEVEVQINSVSSQHESDQSLNSIPENNQILGYAGENGGNSAPDLNFNDDDDVIVREK